MAVVIHNKDGVSWYEAPLPRRWHRCRAQTIGNLDGQFVRRCPCGAIWVMGGWIEKNSRKKKQ